MIAGFYDKSVFNFVRNWQSVLKWSYRLAFPPAVKESSCCSVSSSAFITVVFKILAILTDVWWYFILGCFFFFSFFLFHKESDSKRVFFSLYLSLCFMELILLKTRGELLCGSAFILCLCGISSGLDSSSALLQGGKP